jgi:DNA-directed RNA polymerase subunit RPC12/RpoP
MPDKEIFCSECGKYVGTLKEGSRTMVGLTYICPNCKLKNYKSYQQTEMFQELFGGIFKNKY